MNKQVWTPEDAPRRPSKRDALRRRETRPVAHSCARPSAGPYWRMMMRGIAPFATAMVCSVAVVAAQEPMAVRAADDLCFRAQPRAECRAFFLTNSGPYVQLDALDVDRLRFTVDWGAMVNVSSKNAVGGSWFVFGQSGDNVSTGPVLRWRRWLGPTESLDVALGTPIFTGDSESFDVGSVLGLVKYSPVPWLGVAARPELIRSNVYNCTQEGCPPPVRESRRRLYLGAELGELPGLGLSVAAGITVGVIMILYLADPDCCN